MMVIILPPSIAAATAVIIRHCLLYQVAQLNAVVTGQGAEPVAPAASTAATAISNKVGVFAAVGFSGSGRSSKGHAVRQRTLFIFLGLQGSTGYF